MKVSPIPSGGSPGVNQINTSNNSDRMEAAKAIAAGETPIRVTASDIPIDPQLKKVQESIRRIKMKTNASPDRFNAAPQEEVAQESVISDEAVPAPVTNEATKPLSPQFAALAKQRRALQVKEREIADREKALASQVPSDGGNDLIARLKSSPLSVLQEHGVTYDQLTEALLSSPDSINPDLQKLRDEVKALKEGVDKNFSERDQQAEQQVLTEMLNEAEQLAKDGDEFSLIRDEDEGAYRELLTRIYTTYKKTGQVLEVRDEMQKLENELLEKRLKIAAHEKIKSRLVPPAQQPVPQQRQNTMRTLTNRDSTSLGLSRRERAIMAMKGTLTKG